MRKEWRLCHVLNTFEVDYEGELVTMTVAGEVIEATAHHPIWVVEGADLAGRPLAEHIPEVPIGAQVPGRWVDAIDLRTGDIVLLKDGRFVLISQLVLRHISEKVYNFQVEELECYAVGTGQVLVHNNSKADGGTTSARLAQLRELHGDRFQGYIDKAPRWQIVDRFGSPLSQAALGAKPFDAIRKSMHRHVQRHGSSMTSVEVTLTYDATNMSKGQFITKALALEALGEKGMLVKVPYRTGDYSPMTIRNKEVGTAYRNRIKEVIWNKYRDTNPTLGNRLINKLYREMQPDHVWELQLMGPDTVANLKMLHSATNTAIGNQIMSQLVSKGVRPGQAIRIKWSV